MENFKIILAVAALLLALFIVGFICDRMHRKKVDASKAIIFIIRFFVASVLLAMTLFLIDHSK